jgi:hypothetical protein
MSDNSRWMAVELLSCHICDQETIYRSLLSDRLTNDSGAVAQKFIAWGSSDIMVLWDIPSTGCARTILDRKRDKGILSRQIFFGNPLGVQTFNFCEISQKLPLVGVSFMKFKDHIIKWLPDHALGLSAYSWVELMLNDIVTTEIQKQLPAFDSRKFRCAVYAATGWADCIVVIFSDSYAPIQLAISLFRNISIEDVFRHCKISQPKGADDPIHALVTSCTIPGVRIDYPTSVELTAAERSQAVEKLLQELDPNDQFTEPFCEIQTRPGHLTHAIRLCEEGAVCCRPTFGRTDMLVMGTNAQAWGVPAFLQFFFEKLLPQMATRGSSAVSSETKLGFNGASFRCESDRVPDKPRHKLRDFSRLTPEMTEKLQVNISPHTLVAFQQMGESLASLMHDEATSEYYESLVMCYDAAIKNLTRFSVAARKLDDHQIAEELSAELSTFCEMMDLCFTDRYRGAYPAGESATVPSLTSVGSFHKVLAVADAVANATLDALLYQCNIINLECDWPPPNFPSLAACAHLGNSSSPRVTTLRLVSTGFINAPTHLMFLGQGMTYITHEAGHIFWNGILRAFDLSNSWHQNWDNFNADVCRELREMLADFVTLSVTFRGDARRMTKVGENVLRALVPQSYIDNALDALKRRIILSELCLRVGLRNSVWSSVDLASLWNDVRSDFSEDAVQLKALEESVRAIGILITTEEGFWVCLRSIAMLSNDATIAALRTPRRAALAMMREFFSGDNALGEDTTFLHKMAQVVRKYQA